MKRLALAAFVLAAAVGRGQVVTAPAKPPYHGILDGIEGQNGAGVKDMQAAPKPLVCGKYQHVESVSPCGHIKCGRDEACMCAKPNEDACVDDMHTLTEREWQEIVKVIADFRFYEMMLKKQAAKL